MKRSTKLGLALATAFALPTAISAQAANHVSWGLGGHGIHHSNPFLAGAGGGNAFFVDADPWALAVSVGAGCGGRGCDAWGCGYDAWGCGYDAWGHGYDAWGYGCDHWGCGCDHWSHGCGHGHYDGFFGCPCAHAGHVSGYASLGWLGWSWTPFVSLGWTSWHHRVFAPIVHGPVRGWGGWELDPFWRNDWRPVRFGHARPYFPRGGYVVAKHGYRDAEYRGRHDRPVRRSPLFGPRYKENPRVYVTDNGPERPTSRAVPRGRDATEALAATGGRRGRPSGSVRKAKPRGSTAPDARARLPGAKTRTRPDIRGETNTPQAKPRPIGPAPRSARPRQPRPEATRQPDRSSGRLRAPRRPGRPSVQLRPSAGVRPVPQRGRRAPSARVTPRKRPPTATRVEPGSARPKASRAPGRALPKARPAPRRTPPRAKPASTRRPAPKRVPVATRRPAKKRGK